MSNIHFNQIKISGFRGRKFTLNMNPKGQHTVFVMDNNTGKTTTIELLRWCFKYPESRCIDRFDHMWNKPAHILDDEKSGRQECNIEIYFDATDIYSQHHNYKFTRTVIGEFIEGHGAVGDNIESVVDRLEIDSGVDMKPGDLAFEYLERNFRFNQCAEYFCFDGEKAREVMQMAANAGTLDNLLNDVNQRVTHPQLESFEKQLNELRNRVHREARSNITDRALQLSFNKIRTLSAEEIEYQGHVDDKTGKIANFNNAISRLKNRVEEIDKTIDNSRINNLIDRKGYEIKQTEIIEKINGVRTDVIKSMSKWIRTDYVDEMNEIKSFLRETGKLPEPYREDLISSCLEQNICHICGRELDEDSKEHVHSLSQLIASYKVQEFLSNTFILPDTSFDPTEIDNDLKELILNHSSYESKIKQIQLTDTEQQLIDEMEFKKKQINKIDDDKNSMLKELSTYESLLLATQIELNDEQERNDALQEYKIILKKITDSKIIIKEAAKAIRVKAIEIISEVISDGVSSILGPSFTARLTTEKGLLLGENGFYGKEKGGYGGRLILSYCFAEAMTLIDPIIVDTPVGNIGTHREKLAQHLFANHKQVVLLCLPTEIENFSHVLSDKPIMVTNEA